MTGYSYVRDYVLTVRFDDGFERTIDFEPILLGPLFGALRDPSLFRRVRVDRDLGTLVWPNGADIDPNVLYEWPQHVDAIVQRRRQRWTVDHDKTSGRERSERVPYRVAEANHEPYEVAQPAETDNDQAD